MRRTLAERWGIVWPFPRLRYRLRHGVWCDHRRMIRVDGEKCVVPAWEPGDHGRADGWRMVDLGRRQMRRCGRCEHTELR